MATYKIDTPAGRAKLAPRRKPCFHKVLTNRFVGFRYTLPAKNKDGTPHEWVALLAGLTHHKLPAAPLFANEKGGHWQAWAWNAANKPPRSCPRN